MDGLFLVVVLGLLLVTVCGFPSEVAFLAVEHGLLGSWTQ